MGDSKRDRYLRIRRQLAEELGKSDDPVARMATIAALLHHKQPRFSWTGFYRRVENDDLVVGPYQGALACQVLPAGQGVCGAVVERGQPVIVPDVREHPGHIACDARSRSEIVVPFRDERGAVAGVLDVDSTQLAAFDELDAEHLEAIAAWVHEPADLGERITPRAGDRTGRRQAAAPNRSEG